MKRVQLEPFEDKYRASEDPWSFATSHYEQRKYRLTVASLPRARYRRVFEPGCSIGALTISLADVADELRAQDASPTAVERARARVADQRHVTVSAGTLPEQWPDGTFDLVVFSELGYYWDEVGLRAIVDRLADSLTPDGQLVAVHWLGSSPDHLLHGQQVHDIVGGRFGRALVHHVEAGLDHRPDQAFVLDVWDRP